MLGFIILRHVSQKEHDRLWIHCYECIRQLYDAPILIIDDNSDESLLGQIKLDNCTVVKSEFPKRGELLPYYYFHKLAPFEKAVILHDSMFIKKKLDVESIDEVKFLWHFDRHVGDRPELEKSFIKTMKSEQVMNLYDSKNWHGCFGVASVITHNYITHLQEKYNLFALLDVIESRNDRMRLERIFALLCFHDGSVTKKSCSIFGRIHNFPGCYSCTFSKYQRNPNRFSVPIIKVWSSR